MKQRIHLLIPLLAISALAVSVGQGATVFLDTFSQTPGTAVVGSTPDVGGGVWTGSGPNISPANTYDTTIPTASGSYTAFDTFTSALGPGKILTLDYDTLVPSTGTNNVFTGWGGVSLFSGGTGGTEEIFTGNSALGSWGTDGAGSFWTDRFHQETDGDSNVVNHIHFTYNFNTGAITFSTDNGGYSGTEEAGVVLNALRIGNGAGDQLNIDNLTVDISAIPVVTFTAVSPANGSYSGSRTNVSLQAIDGSYPVNTNTIAMTVDGGTVTPSITKSNNITTILYVPNTLLSAGSLHTAVVTLQDSNAVSYTNAWSFTTGFPSLPATLPGPIAVSNSVDVTVFTAAGDGWLGTNYLSTSGQTLYARFSMEFDTTNDTSGIYTWGGMDFFQGSNEKLLFGKNGGSANWSIAIDGADGPDLNPAVMVVTNDWHTIVVRIDYQDGAPANETVWLDPDFTQTEANQPQAPVTLSDDNTFDNIHLRCGFNDASATFSNIIIAATSAGIGFVAPTTPTFENYVPGQNASSAPTSAPIGLEVLSGTYGISTNAVTLNLDGNNVTPAFIATTNSITLSYQPPAPFAAGSVHTATVSLTDSNGSPYSTSWTFTVDSYPSLPVTNAGPFYASTGDDVILWTNQNEWIGDNYSINSTNTLYTRFSMTFDDLNGETGSGGGFGGLEFYLGETEQFLIGNNWLSTNWSVSVATESTADIPPVTPIVFGSWHTIVVKSVYTASTNTLEKVWLDPDFTKSEGNQPNPPLTLTCNNTFDNIHLRAGNGSAFDEFTNIVMAATAQGVGFAAPSVLSIQNTSSGLRLSWTETGTLLIAPTVNGPWTTSGDQANPQILSTTNSMQFFMVQQ